MATVTLTATDQDGRTGSCSFTVHNEEAARDTAAGLAGYDFWPADQPGMSGVLTDTPRRLVQSITTVPGKTYRDLVLPFDYTPPAAVDGAPPIVFRNTEIVGKAKAPLGSGGMVIAWGAGHAPVEFYDSLLKPQNPNPNHDGIRGHHYKAYRCEVEHVIDGFGVQNTHDPDGPSGVELYGNWLHNHGWWSQADSAKFGIQAPQDGSHPDGIQIMGGSGVTAVGNVFDGFIDPVFGPNFYGGLHINACAMIRPNVGKITGLRIEKNRFDGGAFSINFANWSATQQLGNVGSVSDNRFGRNQRQQGPGGDATWTLNVPPPGAGVFTGNTYADNGHPIKVRRSP